MEQKLKSYLVGMTPFAAMVVLQCLDVGFTTLSKAAMSRGMSHYVFVAYSNALATLILLPPFIFQRTKRQRPPLTFSVLSKFFLLSLIGITVMQNCAITGVSYSSPTLGSAMSNLIPAFTFLLSVIFRMENLDLRSSRCQIKILGALTSITGALIVTLYKGPSIGSLLSSKDTSVSVPSFSILATTSNSNNWIIGGLFFTASSLSVSIWTTYQAAILKGYPSEITVVAFYCLFGTVQSAAVALLAERDNPNAWKLRPDIELISVIYSAVFENAVMSYTQTWCIHKKGPVFVAMFSPLGIGIAVLMSAIFLGDTLHLGSVIGAIIISLGFYGVLRAQSEEEKDRVQALDLLSSSSPTTPLLQSHSNA